ncbi:MAG: glycoside hydrolase family 76 protein [Solirubrobacteraceae bacterium]
MRLSSLVAAAAKTAVIIAALLLGCAARAGVAQAGAPEGLGGFAPLTSWHEPVLALPAASTLDYAQLAQRGVAQSSQWHRRGWYCEALGCPGPWPMLTIWGEVPMFEAADALQRADPSKAHAALLERLAEGSERYWDPYVGGYVPYYEDHYRGVEAYFDDNGWLGLAFLGAYEDTGSRCYLRDAQRALRFIAAKGWDAAGGGGMWWNTSHPYHSGPALASDSLLAALLYRADHERWQLDDAESWVDWANAYDADDERHLYLEVPNRPESVVDYVQAPLIYAQYLLCEDGMGQDLCLLAGRLAATMAEQDIDGFGYEYNYGPEYDAVYLQWMMAYGAATDQGYWLELAQVNALAATDHAADAQGDWLQSWWGGPIKDPETHPGMFRTAAATSSLFAWLAVYSQ